MPVLKINESLYDLDLKIEIKITDVENREYVIEKVSIMINESEFPLPEEVVEHLSESTFEPIVNDRIELLVIEHLIDEADYKADILYHESRDRE